MAHILAISDGTTTLTLSQANGYIVLDESEGLGTDERDVITGDPDDPEITSSFAVLLIGATSAVVQGLSRAVEAILAKGKRRQGKPEGPRVYLQMQVGGEVTAWRAEILDGRFKPNRPLSSWSTGKVPYILDVTHRAWEGARTELSIGTSLLSPATGGRAISQKNNDHYITVAAAQVGGSLPAYVELQLQNTSGSGVGFKNYYMGVSDYGGFTSWVEGEDRVSGYGTVTSDSSCSGSPARYNLASITSAGIIQWDLSSSLMGATEGRELKILTRFFGLSGTGLYIWPIIRDAAGVIELARTPEETYIATANTRLIDMGSLPFPPGGYNPTPGATRMEFSVRLTGSGAVNVDYFFLMPRNSYRHIYQRGYSIPNNSIVVFDDIEKIYHVDNYQVFAPREGRLQLRPGVDQRLYILADEGNSSNVARTFTVRAYVRERRLTV